MRTNKITQLAALTGLALLGATNIASAATVRCPGTLVAPLNRQIEVTGALTGGYCGYKEGNVNGDDFSVFAGFPATYELLDKDIYDLDPNSTEGDLKYVTGNQTSGTWTMSSNLWQSFDRMFIAFHFGGGGPTITPDSFVVELNPGTLTGNWALLPQNLARGLSNIYLLATDPCIECGDDDDDTDLPEPGSLALLGLGLLGLGVSRRRRI